MKGDPRNPADWRKVAERDLASARRCLRDQDIPLAVYCVEQAAEKALKSWLIGRGWSLVKTHNLVFLKEEARVYQIDLSAFETTLARLSRLYFADRYVDDSPDPEPDADEAARLLADVEALFAQLFPENP